MPDGPVSPLARIMIETGPQTMPEKAATAFTFKDFAIDQPRVPVVLSVADEFEPKLDFLLVKQ